MSSGTCNDPATCTPCQSLSGAALGVESTPLASRLITASEIRFSEIISALSVALDITQGHPHGHSMRSAIIGMRIAKELQLKPQDRSALFYALLLKDLGCSSNAAKIVYLFGADDHVVKRSARMIDWTKANQAIRHCWKNVAPGGSPIEKLLRIGAMMRGGTEGTRRIAEVRCERGAEIARLLNLPEATAQAILDLDEHWDGGGFPRSLQGDEISLLGRICCLAQTVEVFFAASGLQAAIDVAEKRRGRWFDPQLVDVLVKLKADQAFWSRLAGDDLMQQLGEYEPAEVVLLANDECLDRVAEGFARVVDAKSPWTYQHSTRVAQIAVGVAEQFGCAPEVLRDIRRAALLHDIGKLGVSNLILDKPGKPTDEEFDQIRKHPDYSLQILKRVGAFDQLADVASAHHERIDGRGYHRRQSGSGFHWVSRVLAVADICEAMSAKRPYRDAIPWGKIQEIMSQDVGTGIDGDCFAALQRWNDRQGLKSRVDAQLGALDQLLTEL
jgi:putative nucleotidyltransferase with HDIG domain